MLRKLTEADTGKPLYVSPPAVIAIDVPPEGVNGKSRMLMAGWPNPIRLAETPEQAIAILFPMHPTGRKAKP